VARSGEDAIDVGEIARLFDGGGHSRAAAASIDGQVMNEVVDRIWQELEQRVRPAATVADLMSYGVHTIEARRPIVEIIGNLRRVGHEGYPALENGRVVGLLTLRDADKALEHGMKQATVRDVMMGGEITLRPRDSVATLEQIIVESGWGQIPVLDDEDRLIGIVTRTDLIKHWAQSHPAAAVPRPQVDHDQIEAVLGSGIAALIERIADQAQEAGVSIYLVGGVVRDLLLKRPNYDIDFVVEGVTTTQAIDFAERLRGAFGGQVSSYQPFGTAKWRINGSVASAIGVSPDTLPTHLDFATSRNEFYEQPTALPTVYAGSIKLDLHRRDFTINTLAIQLSPATVRGRLLDFYGGLGDLQNGLIRVLHSLSFVDDPTRILRAVRFEQRLGFRIESRTGELIGTSLPVLRRITGERIRNELLLLLSETEPERGLLELRQRGVLQAIHPAFFLSKGFEEHFRRARDYQQGDALGLAGLELPDLYLILMLAPLKQEDAAAICDYLRVRNHTAEIILAASDLLHEPGPLARADAPISAITNRLDTAPEGALLAAWLIVEDVQIRERIERYAREWRQVKPITDGHTLRAAGLQPGPRFRTILDRLRAARLDGEITTDAEEQSLLQTLIEQEDHPS
jgi:tRNA nucleotidyltransferase (CCA-adding enzyme)